MAKITQDTMIELLLLLVETINAYRKHARRLFPVSLNILSLGLFQVCTRSDYFPSLESGLSGLDWSAGRALYCFLFSQYLSPPRCMLGWELAFTTF